MSKKRGFTLIELLMVISVIALLTAILMPALAKVRRQVKITLCAANLRQWGVIWAGYTGANNGMFDKGYRMLSEENKPYCYWPATLASYIGGRPWKLTCCPLSNDPCKNYYEENGTWGPEPIPPPSSQWYPPGFYGSYGLNWWVWDRSLSLEWLKTEDWRFWKSTAQKNAGNTPVFLDCMKWNIHPYHKDKFVKSAVDPSGPYGDAAAGYEGFGGICMNRHLNWKTHILFMDWSVRPILLTQLWDLDWQRQWNNNSQDGFNLPPPVFNGWMTKCPKK